MRSTILLILVSLVLIASAVMYKYAGNDTKPIIKLADKYKPLRLIDEITLNNVDDYYTSVNFSLKGDEVIVQYLSEKKDKIYFVNDHKQQIDSISLPKELQDRMFSYYVGNDHNVFVLLNEDKTIAQYHDGKEVKKYVYHAEGEQFKYFMSMYFPFEVKENTVLLDNITNCKIFMTEDRKKYFSLNFLSSFSLRNDSMIQERNFFKFPKNYIDNYYSELFPMVYRLNKDSIVYIFSVSKEAHIYDTKMDKDYTFTINGLEENRLKPYPVDSIQSLSFSHKYELENDKFLKITQDAYSKKLMVIQMLKIEEGDYKHGYAPHYKDKPVLISIMDAKFNVTDKFYLENQKDNLFYGSFYFNKKLYVPQFTKEGKNIVQVYQVS